MQYRVLFDSSLEERDDHWVAKIPAVGVFAYGSSRSEANARSESFLDMVLDHWMNHGVLAERLERPGITLESVDESPSLLSIGRFIEA